MCLISLSQRFNPNLQAHIVPAQIELTLLKIYLRCIPEKDGLDFVSLEILPFDCGSKALWFLFTEMIVPQELGTLHLLATLFLIYASELNPKVLSAQFESSLCSLRLNY